MQKQKVMVSIQPTRPETSTAVLMATGPRMAASWVSSDMLKRPGLARAQGQAFRLGYLLCSAIVIGHGPSDGEETGPEVVSIDSLAMGTPWTHPSRKEKMRLPQPDPSVTSVNTHLALCFSGVKMSRAMQMLTDARTMRK